MTLYVVLCTMHIYMYEVYNMWYKYKMVIMADVHTNTTTI